MRILILGGGGREHALGWALARHGHTLFHTHEHPGLAALAAFRPGDPVTVARDERVDLVVVGPEAPLAEGVVDRLTAAGIPAFGPTRAAAQLETSKVHSKAFCLRHGLPTAAAKVLRPDDTLPAFGPAVVKLDGLAAGKGVWVTGSGAETAAAIAQAVAARPDAPILVEERLEGREVSVLALSDGERVVGLPPARDHKRRFDGDEGPNTGGMGAVAPIRFDAHAACLDVLGRAVRAMAAEGTPFRGVLYGGFMLTDAGPKLLEFNVRFGDPECQPLMALIDEDPAPWFLGAATGRLPGEAIRLRPLAACCVVVVGEHYPERGADAPIEALPADADDLVTFLAGTRRVDGVLRASGGRVLGVTGLGATPEAARARAYAGVAEVRFAGAAWRTDIGARPWT